MSRMVQGKNVVLIVGGGIAAYKSVILARELIRGGAHVRVVMTQAATKFVGPVTFAGVTGEPVLVDLWDPAAGGEAHVALGAWAHAVVVAPATQNLLVRASLGLADDAALTTLACCDTPALFAPAMHTTMWKKTTTQRAVSQLREDGAHFVGPAEGALASGEMGVGRMAEPEEIASTLAALLRPGLGTAATPGDLKGKKVLITAGPTAEDLDPVRFFTNRSTGKMGVALAERAAARGANVTLVQGPGCATASERMPLVGQQRVRSASDMHRVVSDLAAAQDVVIMAAAVADYRPATVHETKLKKADGELTLTLKRNPDILAELGSHRSGTTPLLIGFALETLPPATAELCAAGREKLKKKGCDLIVANSASASLGGDTTHATLVSADAATTLPPQSKCQLADSILDWAATQLRD